MVLSGETRMEPGVGGMGAGPWRLTGRGDDLGL